jgi:hypothetical protein
MRAKIRAHCIIAKLQKHVESDRRDKNGRPVGLMDSSAVAAALGLLRKVLPDLAAIEHSETIENNGPAEMSDAELNAAIAAVDAQIRALTGEEAAEDEKVCFARRGESARRYFRQEVAGGNVPEARRMLGQERNAAAIYSRAH